jgi:hypothetical protein
MNKLETCHHCGEEKENCYHGYITMCLPIPEAEAQIEKWNLIDAYRNYLFNSEWFPLSSVSGGLIGTNANSGEIITENLFINKIKRDDEFSKKWFTKKWYNSLERTDLTEEEFKELDSLSMYDQMLNTVGRGVQCDDCGRKEAELYEIYYPKSLES